MYAISRGKAARNAWYWVVHIRRRGVPHYRRFYDAGHGGEREAHKAAIAWRDGLLTRLQRLTQREFNEHARTNNRSGAPGVHFLTSLAQPAGFWQAKLKLPDKQGVLTKSYSVKKFGEAKARARAVCAREEMLDRLGDRAYGKEPSKEEEPLAATDAAYARDLFTELAYASVAAAGQLPSAREINGFAERAISMAMAFHSAQQKMLSSGPPRASVRAAKTERRTTFAKIARHWMARVSKRSAGNSHQSMVSRMERYVIPYIGNKHVDTVIGSDILSILRAVQDAGYAATAFGIFKDICAIYRYAIARNLTANDPTTLLRRVVTPPPRKGTLTPADPGSIGRLLVAIRNYKGKPNSSVRHLLRLAPLVFLRPGELRTLEWPDVDFGNAIIPIPAARMKMRRPHLVPLASQAIQILREVQTLTGDGRFVFTAGRGIDKPLHFSIFYVALRALGFGKIITPHGFRVMASTWLNEQGWRADVIECQLSHLGHDRTRRLYNRAQYMPERRKMMQAWADHLDDLEAQTRRTKKRLRRVMQGEIHVAI